MIQSQFEKRSLAGRFGGILMLTGMLCIFEYWMIGGPRRIA